MASHRVTRALCDSADDDNNDDGGPMKEAIQPAAAPPKTGDGTAKPKKRTAINRITLALLERYALEGESRGSDPYNTRRSPQIDYWRGNAKRL